MYQDQVGSTRRLSNTDMTRDYTPFGETLVASGNNDNNYQFSQKELDSDIGLYYFGARYYNPGIGRWFTPDPAGQGFSPYVYCGNNPLSIVDPDGEFAFLAPILFGGFSNAVMNKIFSNGQSNFETDFFIGAAFGAMGLVSAGGVEAAMQKLGAEVAGKAVWNTAYNETGVSNFVANNIGRDLDKTLNFLGPTFLEGAVFNKIMPTDPKLQVSKTTMSEDEIDKFIEDETNGWAWADGQIGRDAITLADQEPLHSGSYNIYYDKKLSGIARHGGIHAAMAAPKGGFVPSKRGWWEYISRNVCHQQAAQTIRKAIGKTFLPNQLLGNTLPVRLSTAVFSGGYGPADGLTWIAKQTFLSKQKY